MVSPLLAMSVQPPPDGQLVAVASLERTWYFAAAKPVVIAVCASQVSAISPGFVPPAARRFAGRARPERAPVADAASLW